MPTVVCSASPDFILKPICKKLEVEYLVCTEVDGKSGKILSKTCKGKEKVIRLNEKLEGFTYAEVYSDSEKHDLPILKLGEKAFLVTDGKVRELRL